MEPESTTDSAARLGAALADRYAIEREIGQGGMATVYLARDVKHDREVALKVLRPELAAVLGAERFLNEIRITARLDHPHILTLIDSGAVEGALYYVVPYVRGGSLRDRLTAQGQLRLDDALRLTTQIASALDYAHRQGVIHRDIKPENILFQEDMAMLADFGIALALRQAGGQRLTETGLSLGTPQYMSPEQATGDKTLDARSDVYSLAAVLYEMLAGDPPITGSTVQAVIAKLLTERPTRLRVLRDTVPAGVEDAVAQALAKVPADRYDSAGAFASAIAAGAAGQRPAHTRSARASDRAGDRGAGGARRTRHRGRAVVGRSPTASDDQSPRSHTAHDERADPFARHFGRWQAAGVRDGDLRYRRLREHDRCPGRGAEHEPHDLDGRLGTAVPVVEPGPQESHGAWTRPRTIRLVLDLHRRSRAEAARHARRCRLLRRGRHAPALARDPRRQRAVDPRGHDRWCSA